MLHRLPLPDRPWCSFRSEPGHGPETPGSAEIVSHLITTVRRAFVQCRVPWGGTVERYPGRVTSALAKGWQILDYLAGTDGPVTVRGLAEGTGIPKSTVHRLATELQGWGALEAVPDGYRLGLQLFELGGISLRQHRLEEEARPIMEELHEATHRLTQLGVLSGTDVMYLARVGPQAHQRVASPVAGRIPATCTALGKALLALNGPALADAVRKGLVRNTPHSITDPTVLVNQLGHVRREGFAIEHEEARLGLACVASPVMTGGRAAAALSLTGPSDTFDPSQAAPAVRAAARRLSRALTARTVIPTSGLHRER